MYYFFVKNGFGYIFGDFFFTNSSGHPGCTKVFCKMRAVAEHATNVNGPELKIDATNKYGNK
jgi:hypothetical protein